MAASWGSDPNPAGLGYKPLPLDLHYSHVALNVSGDIPTYLDGTLFRGAPGAWPDGWWLDGLITLNAFRFRKGGVTYSMQWSKDEVYNRTVAGRAPAAPLDRAPVPGGIPHPADSSWQTGVAFRRVQGQILGSTGVSSQNSFDFDSLEPLETPFRYSDSLGAPFLAPTHEQTVDGHIVHHLATGMQAGSGGTPGYVVYTIKPGSRTREVIAKIERPKESSPLQGYPSFQHQPLATPEYYVMLESPCFYPGTVTVVGSVDWKGWRSNPLARAHVRLVRRTTGESLVYPLSSNVFAIHQVNAYREPGSNTIVVDTIQLFPSIVPCSTAFSATSMKNYADHWKTMGLGLTMSKLLRLRIPLDRPGAMVSPTPITNVTGMEFPTIRYDDLNGKPYRYVYADWASSVKAPTYDALVKIDVQSGAFTSWRRDGHFPGEPIFVPRPGSVAEDDGVVMTNVLDANRNETYLLLLDGRSFRQIGRAGPTPHVIPHGYHGRYYDLASGHADLASSTVVV